MAHVAAGFDFLAASGNLDEFTEMGWGLILDLGGLSWVDLGTNEVFFFF